MRAALALGCIVLAAARPALADPAADAAALREQGEALAKQGRFTDAIDRFREADRLAPSARHDCFISLAYRRLERWGLAQLHADLCAERARETDPEPTWMKSARKEISDGVARAGLVRVSFIVEPPGAVVRAPSLGGETSAARPLWLAPGERGSVEAPGLLSAGFAVEGSGEQSVRIQLLVPASEPPATIPASAPVQPPPVEPSEPPEPPGRGPWPWIAVSTAGAAAAVGVVFHLKALSTKNDAEGDALRYDDLLDQFEGERAVALGAYAVAVAAGGLGLYLWLRSPPGRTPAVAIGAAPLAGGALVTAEWRPW